jgi:hypothetical protein
MKALFILACLSLIGCAKQTESHEPYMVEGPRLNVEYPVYVLVQDDSECSRKDLAKTLCKGFSKYVIEQGPSSDVMNSYTVRCSK